MYPFIVCFCGRALGDIYDAFLAMRLAKYIEVYGDLIGDRVDPDVIPISDKVGVDLQDVFETLNIPLQCCRMHLATQVEFKTLY